jgi:UDP-N-acetyl-D-mannosaminuronic acid dehydrogenase
MPNIKKNQISIIGGAGHVGFPLGLAFAYKNLKVNLIDTNTQLLKLISNGNIPFMEKGAKKVLNKCLKKKNLLTSTNIESIIYSKYIIICIGTPIDRNLKPKFKDFIKFFKDLKKYLHKDHIIIIRSSIYPGVVEKVEKILKEKNNNIVYCPERIVQGKSLEELPKLPQIIASNNKKIINEVENLFKKITPRIILTSILEAELIKLFSNANRYINFSIANQFYLMCSSMNLDYSRIRNIMQDGYERNLNLSKAGFTAGPCLLKDTMQLSSFFKKKFNLGHAAMNVNESMPDYIIGELKKIKNIKKKTIGILGLSFKADNDDIRDSLAIKLLNNLKRSKFKVIQSDENYNNIKNVSKKDLIKKSSIIIIGAPHKQYKTLKFPKNKKIIDIWNIIK